MKQIALIILTHNAKDFIANLFESIKIQTLQLDTVLIIDSATVENNVRNIVKKYGFKYHAIKPAEFNHGNTRQLGVDLVVADFYIFMTQDAVLADKNALQNLIAAFADEKVGCAYGQQLPNANANTLATHARLFNYPAQSAVKSYGADANIKTCFNSDSFAAYRKSALMDVGGFPKDIIMGEDVIVAAKMLLKNWKVAYQADAFVYHSHNYTLRQEFKRYFDIGAFHAAYADILSKFASPSGEGMKYMKSEWKFCLKNHAYWALIKSFFSILVKFLGYNLGKKWSKNVS